MQKSRILLVEDDASLREVIRETLLDAGFLVSPAEDATHALAILESDRFDMVVSDIQMPKMSGCQLLVKLQKKWPDIPVVLMTAYGTIEQAVIAMRDGARDYLVKPFEAETLINTIRKNLVVSDSSVLSAVIVDSASKQLFELAARVARSSVSVLIDGESGSGKEVVARFIHQHSDRKDGPFIAINCAAIPENMLEAVLFGYEKGAFTGAYKRTPGKFELAQGGTLLLDEISEMDLGLQAKLLRVIQEKEIERLGGQKLIELDVRVLATTNRDLREYVGAGKFREDLFYRLNVFPLTVPPLRDRVNDVIALAKALIEKYSDPNNSVLPKLSTTACKKLQEYSWPGNVRELENVIQRALLISQTEEIQSGDLIMEGETAEINPTSNSSEKEAALDSDLKKHEQELILQALRAGNGSRKLAAESLGISARTLRYKISRMRDQGIAVPKAWGAMSA